VSDQNQWPKPGGSDGAADGQQHDGQSRDEQSHGGQPSQGTSYGQAAQGGSYGQQPQGTPNGQASQSSPYAQPSQGSPYAQSSQGSPYGQPSQGSPYGQPSQGTPYGGSSQGGPSAQPGQGAPYGQQQGNPYAASGPQHNPYAPQQGHNPYATPYATGGYQPYAQRPKTNTLAILSIVFAFAGIIIWPIVILTSPAGAIMGHIALGKIKQSGEGGRGLALAGVIGGWVMTGLWILIVGLVVILGIAAGSSGGYSDPYDYDPGAFIG